ncbi:MAG: hypothetical protein JW725_01130 [Candidatus Babeliaceae bacterium]|nr:hypothetical protein [Candidatus Babeliaceae bacterium]
MMTNLKIIHFVLLFFAYIFSITLTGSIQARINRCMGDGTAEDVGFAEFNPFIHVGFLDVIFFVLLKIMFGTPLPVNPSNIRGPYRPLKLGIVFLGRTLIYLFLALFSATGLILLVKSCVMVGAAPKNPFALIDIAQQGATPLVYVLSLFFGLMVVSTTFLSAFCGIRDLVYGFVVVRFEKDARFVEYANPIMIFGVLLLLVFFADPITNFFLRLVCMGAMAILAPFGL